MRIVYFVVLFFVLCPATAYAWGPGFHLEIALDTLEKAALFSSLIAPLVKEYPRFFVYGAVSPDITVGKRYAGYMHHCHNWRMGKLILKEAETDAQKAAAYGYLVHLAADVVAHNYYIPFKIVRSYSARLLNHTYWEMRFDLSVPSKVWKRVKDVTKGDFSEFDDLMKRVLRKTLFSFRTNKRIFSGIVVAHKMLAMRQTMDVYARRSKWTLAGEDVRHYRELTYRVVRDFLVKLGDADCVRANPVGVRKLAYASSLRKRLRQCIKRKLLTERDVDVLLVKVKNALRESIFDPSAELPDEYSVI